MQEGPGLGEGSFRSWRRDCHSLQAPEEVSASSTSGRHSSKGRIAASSLKVTRYTHDKYGDHTASSSSPPLPMTVKVFGDL